MPPLPILCHDIGMKLSHELEGQFLKREEKIETWTRRLKDGTTQEVTGPREIFAPVATLADADGVIFLCPLCYKKNGGTRGTHSVICWFEGKVPDETSPKPGRWTPSGTGLDDLTFVPSPTRPSVSVQLNGGCSWHGYVVAGDAL